MSVHIIFCYAGERQFNCAFWIISLQALWKSIQVLGKRLLRKRGDIESEMSTFNGHRSMENGRQKKEIEWI